MNPIQKVPKYKDPVLDATGKQVGVAVFDPNTGKALQGAEAFNPNDGKPITTDMLAPKPDLKLPEKTVDTTANGIISDATTSAQSFIDKNLAAEQLKRDTQETEISKLMKDISGVQAKESIYQEQAGVFANQDAINAIDDSILVKQKALKNKLEEVKKDPFLTQDLYARIANDETRKVASEMADLQISRSLLTRDYDRAVATAERKIQNELAPLKADLEMKKYFYDNNKDYFNTLQSKQLDTIIRADERKIKNEEDRLNQINNLVIEAGKNGADEATLNKIRAAKDVGEATIAMGKYSTDPLERSIKQAQLNKINQEIAQDGVKFSERNMVTTGGDIISTLPKGQQERYYKLQNDFDDTTKAYRGAIDASANLKALSSNSTAQDQTAIIFSYMKTLDPSSTVREGEFALVGKTAGLGDRALIALKNLDSGKRLNENQIKDIVGASNKLAAQAKKNLDATSAEYDRRASKFGLPSGMFYEPQEIPKLTEDEFINTVAPSLTPVTVESAPSILNSLFSVFNKPIK